MCPRWKLRIHAGGCYRLRSRKIARVRTYCLLIKLRGEGSRCSYGRWACCNGCGMRGLCREADSNSRTRRRGSNDHPFQEWMASMGGAGSSFENIFLRDSGFRTQGVVFRSDMDLIMPRDLVRRQALCDGFAFRISHCREALCTIEKTSTWAGVG